MPNRTSAPPVSAKISTIDDLLITDPTNAVGDLESLRYAINTPERRLVHAVLDNGINQLLKNVPRISRTQRNRFKEASTWILDDDPSFIFSFVNCCFILKIDPEYLRKGLLQLIKSQINDKKEN